MSREAFESWALRNTSLPSAHEMAWAAWQAALARQQAEPTDYYYEWDTSDNCLHRSFSPAAWNGRNPDRSIPLYATPQQAQPTPAPSNQLSGNSGTLSDDDLLRIATTLGLPFGMLDTDYCKSMEIEPGTRTYGEVTCSGMVRFARAVLGAQPAPAPVVPDDMKVHHTPWVIAQNLHRIYESLAPSFGYETRPETRGWVTNSPNGKLMRAAVEQLMREGWIAAAPAPVVPDGWVIVPREPTEAMVLAASMAWDRSGAGLYDSFAAALRGGIQAAPGSAPAAPAVQPLTDEQINAIWSKDDSPEFRTRLSPWGMDRIRAIIAASNGIAAPGSADHEN